MKRLRRTLTSTEARLRSNFWRVAAASTGFAVDHPSWMRLLPIVLLAAGAFALGRAAGTLLSPTP